MPETTHQPMSVSKSSPDHPPVAWGAIQLIIICSIFTPLAIVAVGLRLWARRVKRQHLVFNDWIIIVALVFNCGQSVLLMYASIANGIGHHMEELLSRWPGTVPRLLKCYVAAEPLWITTNTLVKISILDFYLKVFSTSKAFKYVCYGMMGLVAAYWVSTFVRVFFLCTPLAAMWDPTLLQTVPGAHCLNLTAVYLSVSIINLLLDFALFILPMPLLWGLHLHSRKKLMLTGVFGLGLFICAVTGLRIRSVLTLDLSDVSYTVTGDGIWSTLEPCLGIVNACLPLFQPLCQKVGQVYAWSTMRSGLGRSTTASGGNTNYLKSEGKAARAGLDVSKQHRMFVPLREDTWAQEEIETGWAIDTVPLEPVHKSSLPKKAPSSDEPEGRSIQVTRAWDIYHEQV